MRLVMGIASVVSVIGVVDNFGLFYIGKHYLHLNLAVIQTLMYLKMSVGGHFKIFITRTRGAFWSIRPAKILLVAVFSTQILATLVAVYGLFMPHIGWNLALLIWGYSLVFFLINDRIKLIAYRFIDPIKVETSLDVFPKIAMRAYELYEQHGHRDGQASQDWLEAEGEIQKDKVHK